MEFKSRFCHSFYLFNCSEMPIVSFESASVRRASRLFYLLGSSPPRRCIQLTPERPSLVLMNQQWRLFSSWLSSIHMEPLPCPMGWKQVSPITMYSLLQLNKYQWQKCVYTFLKEFQHYFLSFRDCQYHYWGSFCDHDNLWTHQKNVHLFAGHCSIGLHLHRECTRWHSGNYLVIFRN